MRDRTVDYEDWHFKGLATPLPKLKDILDRAIAARTSPVNGSIEVKIKALRFPDLEEENADLIQELYQQMLGDHCPALRHLILSSFDDGSQGSHHAIQAATELKTVRAFRFNDESGWSSRDTISTLVKHHSKTLEEVELLLCRMISSRDQQALFVSCKQLKRFWMVPDGTSPAAYEIEFRDIFTGAWNCLGMRELSLTFNRFINVKKTVEAMRLEGSKGAAGDRDLEVDEVYRPDDMAQERRAGAWAAKQAFAQIGRLTALEHLALGTDEGPNGSEEDVLESKWDLTLSKGWLAQLAGLKNLRHFHMRTDHWSCMGQAEVEFMDAEWPWLDCVSFDWCSMTDDQFMKEVSLPHWQWLQQKRPSLRLSVIQMYTEADCAY
ncbi:hypothetical protein BGZ70_005641 [Mortierella alpina]|uniref:Uncharacterized protein n=1 Tax=Mortierella alpina TaxID=64518 RepID=A0A9P6J957_MORAP|nr:hypothetical protein BGZ70_005641 [Mortierella alpina]